MKKPPKEFEDAMEQKYLTAKLEDNTLWKQATKLSELFYGLLDEFPEEERYIAASKLRSLAFNLTVDIAESLGSITPNNRSYYMGLARRDVYGLKATYRLSGRQKLISLDPQVMVELDNVLGQVNAEIEDASKDAENLMAMEQEA
jgi:hypothetical protein